MTAIKIDFQRCLMTLGIVLTMLVAGCGGGATGTSAQSTDGTRIVAGTFSSSQIYINSSTLGIKQASIQFSALKATTPLANQSITLTLDTQSQAAGVTFAGGGTSTTVITDASGLTPLAYIQSGDIPTSVSIIGRLNSNSAVFATASGLSVASGSPTQSRTSLAISKTSIEGWDHDGETVGLTMAMADRLGNPVPDGTTVNFVATAGGYVTPPTCTTTNSKCSVTLNSGGTRVYKRVAVLAYASGEQSFTDNNGNNIYDTGEIFVPLGTPYLDENRNGSYDSGEQTIGTAPGSNTCTSASFPSVANTCTSTWSNNARVRAETEIFYPSSYPTILVGEVTTPSTSTTLTGFKVAPATTAGFKVFITDLDTQAGPDGYQAPPGSSVTAALVGALPSGKTCTVAVDIADIGTSASFEYTNGSTKKIYYYYPTTHSVVLTEGASGHCSGRTITVTVKTPKNVSTSQSVLIP